MGQFTGDLQILLYTTKEQFMPCCAFYELLLEESPYYTWDEGPDDCGAKFHAGRGTIGVLCQTHAGALGPCALNLETGSVDQAYEGLRHVPQIRFLRTPETRPYGTRCFSVEDPCGNQINVYRRVSEPLTASDD